MSCPITGEPTCRCSHKQRGKEKPTPKETLRKLFTDHAVYTKFVITDVLEKLPNTDADLNRLLENQEDIGKFVGKIVGTAKGKELTKLLKEHIQLAGACVIALASGKSLKAPVHDLFANSDQVGEFLHSLNPSALPLKDTKRLFHEHNQHVLDIATAQHAKKVKKVVALFDAYYTHMLMLSDTLAAAL